MIGRKQTAKNEDFVAAWANIKEMVPQERVEQLIEQAVAEVKEQAAGKRAAYGWSGGKDSQALRVVMERAGIDQGVMALTEELEYPAFEHWTALHQPSGVQIVRTSQTLVWLEQHQEMLFPQTAKLVSRWYRIVQHTVQDRYANENGIEIMFLGRRKQDGNYMGRTGNGMYRSRGILKAAPIRDWTQEEVMACCAWCDMPLPPIYEWPRGWVVGTGPWPARTYTKSVEHGWSEVYEIDPSIVLLASEYLPSAEAFLEEVTR